MIALVATVAALPFIYAVQVAIDERMSRKGN